MRRTTGFAALTVVISALMLTLSPQTLNPIARAQNSGPKSRMYCIGFGKPNNHLYRVDNYATTTPTAVDLGATGQLLTDIAITPSGTAYAITITGLYKIDLENGKTTLIKELFDRSQNSLEAASDDRLLVWGPGDTWIRSIDLNTLKVTKLVDPGKFGADLALAPGGIDLYGTTLDGLLIKVNLTTQAVTTIGPLGIKTDFMSGLDFASDGQLYGTHGSNKTGLAEVYKINVCTGEAVKPGRTIARANQLGNGGMAMKW
jgi:hypothetical protein